MVPAYYVTLLITGNVYVLTDYIEDFITYCKTMSVMPHGGAMDEAGQFFYI